MAESRLQLRGGQVEGGTAKGHKELLGKGLTSISAYQIVHLICEVYIMAELYLNRVVSRKK